METSIQDAHSLSFHYLIIHSGWNGLSENDRKKKNLSSVNDHWTKKNIINSSRVTQNIR